MVQKKMHLVVWDRFIWRADTDTDTLVSPGDGLTGRQGFGGWGSRNNFIPGQQRKLSLALGGGRTVTSPAFQLFSLRHSYILSFLYQVRGSPPLR